MANLSLTLCDRCGKPTKIDHTFGGSPEKVLCESGFWGVHIYTDRDLKLSQSKHAELVKHKVHYCSSCLEPLASYLDDVKDRIRAYMKTPTDGITVQELTSPRVKLLEAPIERLDDK